VAGSWRSAILKILFFLFSAMLSPHEESLAGVETAKIAYWHKDYEAAVSLRFDDSLESHVRFVIPTLDRYGFKATFMVNPGRSSYIRNRSFWEREVVSRGHRLGNHTMHHRGAKTIEEAQFEIGEAARILRSVPTGESELMVFAAGGMTKWGGADWEDSASSYRHLVSDYKLIDLYDGFHPSENYHSTDTPKGLCGRLQSAIEKRSHQTFVFHDIGSPGIKDFVKRLIYGHHLTIAEEDFKEFAECLHRVKERTWIAPLVNIYKYEAERNGSSLVVVERKNNVVRLRLQVKTDPSLYDQKLTIVFPDFRKKIVKILQDGKPVEDFEVVKRKMLASVEPKQSEISIFLERNTE
jgi:hypothetical protein